MTAADNILVVDDDAEIRALLSEYLTREGYKVTTVPDGRAMDEALEDQRFDLVVLDLMLPGEDGISLCRRLRAKSILPVIMLTARGEEADRITGLETGADDYLPKPFNPRELLVRIQSVLRRARTLPENLTPEQARRFSFAGWHLDTATRQLVSPTEVVVPLSGAEYRLLLTFLHHAGEVLSRDRLTEIIRGRGSHMPFDRSIDVQVSRLRQRLGDDGRVPALIRTVRGEGYLFAIPVDVQA
ncbi:MAG TPA: response regulator [Gammaproteobacteria bacterium]|nr:response regulator [Gammaproteobacteria bacterium]HEV2333052.1 response regulator [Gammaproteobacteria bacterium]